MIITTNFHYFTTIQFAFKRLENVLFQFRSERVNIIGTDVTIIK